MKWLRTVISLFIAAAVFWGLDNRHGLVPPLGKLLNPFAGFWQNGTRGDQPATDLVAPGVREDVRIAWDARLVPHIFARNDHDLYFAQGYVAASLRLWQMEFQVLFAAGRLSEVVGPMGLEQDRFKRRFGMVWAAENALEKFRSDPKTREAIEGYAAGVNAYIRSLPRKALPVEYKILDYAPEPWTELKSALLLKYMAYILTSYNQDAAMTGLRDALGERVVEALFPYDRPLVDPVIPRGTAWDFTPVALPRASSEKQADRPDPSVRKAEAEAGTAGYGSIGLQPGPGVGSNNWAVSGKRTKSGFPILCNDMHLGLSLPAIWYELQLSSPGLNARGASFPGAPLVVAGYNGDIAWGYTNGTDDVLDWYAVRFRDGTRAEYLYDGQWRKATFREERIKVRGAKTVVDRVVYTHQGPVVRLKGEPPFSSMDVPVDCALRWLGHDPSNEFKTLDGLNRAKNYGDYLKAMESWDCPSQNIIYADKEGTVAIWHQGRYPLRRKGQGRYILDGSDPADDWHGWVPQAHVPHVENPARGFVSSANQMPADSRYPYFLGVDYASYERGARINEILAAAKDILPGDMIRMQRDVLDMKARAVLPRLLNLVRKDQMTEDERRSFDELRSWDFQDRAASVAPTIFTQFWYEVNALTWNNKKAGAMARMPWPSSEVMVDLILNRPDSEFFDDKTTPERETLADIADRAFRSAVSRLEKKWGPFGPAWRWGRSKGTRIGHLAMIPGLGREAFEADGDSTTINAIAAGWAPSWRMVVELGPEVRAWGIYPGGQSGNPGSKFYDDMVDDWLAGKPDKLIFLRSADEPHPGIVARTTLRGGK
jgi:penicillin amidase